MASPFDVLGIEPGADDSTVVQAYRQRVKETHPDRGGSVREFKAVQTAYAKIQNGYDPEDEEAEEIETEPVREERPETRVEYLNYEVFDDFGWDIHDEDLFEKAAETNLNPRDYGRLLAHPRDALLESVEETGFAWPFACRGGACANCAVAVVEGDIEMPPNHVLSENMMEKGIRLSCIGTPCTDELKVVFNVKHLPGLDELKLPSQRFDTVRAEE
ncbi:MULTISPECIES: ferredoxin Fer [unclassified Haladaptatus]|uniref:ferredoxin Fer n=1 Tax=unclassified Haladaptatus TaxID=2622732 RepID=UPI0023E8B0E5|nr:MULTISPECIES: ferredoxin Fer [unclassified Haladaptatus]